MSPPDGDELAVLHQLRLRGLATLPELSERLDRAAPEVEATLAALAAVGSVRASEPPRAEDRGPAWTLTAAGRAAGEQGLATDLDRAEGRERLTQLYERFRACNGDLLAVCTDWQLRPVDGRTVVNDHLDAGYDAGVVARLAGLDHRAQPLCAELTGVLGRFGGYGPRLARARARVEAGDGDWFTKPTIDSYHTVWFELHEDLLATLGIERAGEPAA